MMEDKQMEDEGIELITEWPVTSCSKDEDSHPLSICPKSDNGQSVCQIPRTGQHSSLVRQRLGKRQRQSPCIDHSHRVDSTYTSSNTRRENPPLGVWKEDFSPRETLKLPRISGSVETDCREKIVFAKGKQISLENIKQLDRSNPNSSSSPSNDCFSIQRNSVENSGSSAIVHLRGKGDKSEECNADQELQAQPRIARWWRRRGQQMASTGGHKNSLPMTTNPNTLLFHVARLPEGRAFLEDERQKLKELARVGRRKADVMAALGSIEEWLGNPDDAVVCLKQAVSEEPDNKEWRWLLQKVLRQQRMRRRQRELLSTVPSCPVFPAARQVERVSCRDLSFADFFHQYALPRRPVIITDMVSSMTTVPWDLQHMRDIAGQCQAKVKQSVPGSVEWAGLEDSKQLKVSQFLDGLQDGCCDYLFDWSLPLHCPDLAQELTIPRYFAGDFLQRSAPGSLYKDSWPSLFIAPAGAHSGLHVDAFASNFWMALFQGRKRWVFFHEEDTPCLYPVYTHSLDPTFEANVVDPDPTAHPLLTCVHPVECVLSAGELLFVPGGSPHYVENLDTTLAISANFVDLSNFTRVLEELDVNSLLDPRAADLAWQFRQPDFVSDMKIDMCDLPWKDFKSWPPDDLDQYCLKSNECDHQTLKSAN